ncbi:MAG: type IV pilus twitching motility protein PilT [Acidobacteriales bacterium]|nr:type IV pilus twitching motility protein PilT [Terriglobales bacterium]
MSELENLLSNPPYSTSPQIMFQSGKAPMYVNAQGSAQPAGGIMSDEDVGFFLEPLMPANVKTALEKQPVMFQTKIGTLGNFEVRIARDANGIKAILKKVGDGPAVPSPLSVAQAAAKPAAPVVAPPAAAAAAPASAPTSAPASVSAPSAAQPVASMPGRKSIEMDTFFAKQMELKASDLHLSSTVLPMLRIDGEMAPIPGYTELLSPDYLSKILFELMPEKNREEFKRRRDTDFAYELGTEARFRCNVFMDRKGMGGVFRQIPTKILTAEQLNLSKDILKLCYLTKGLVLVTGPTGSGKSTTLCAMIDHVNKNLSAHIITIEDPIEFVHENQKCLVNQREVHSHTDSFKDALRAALREDPNIILVGEMRDLETIAIAIEMAETGHLVFGTLHTSTAPSTVDRIIDQFPADRQSQIRVMLSESLKGVIAQTLCKKVGGGRIAALEVLLIDGAVANLIREGKTTQIPSSMQTGKGKGNVTLNDALFTMVKDKKVEPKEAYVKAVDKVGFEGLLKRENVDTSFITPSPAAPPAAGAAK